MNNFQLVKITACDYITCLDLKHEIDDEDVNLLL